MQFIQVKNREQRILFPQSLDQIITPDNEVHIIDLFAESLSAGQAGIQLEDFKFVTKTSKEGRPAYFYTQTENPVDSLSAGKNYQQAHAGLVENSETVFRLNVFCLA